MRSLVLLTALLGAVVEPAGQASPGRQHAGLERYLAKVAPAIRSYRLLGKRVEAAVSRPPISNVDPLVESLQGFANGFDRLAGRWSRIASPRVLEARHRDLGTAFALESQAFRLQADALSTRDPDLIVAQREHLGGLFRSAAYLQKRWAAALRGALRRARLPIRPWLRGMATMNVR
jgi:hypothetical protein